MLRKLDLVDARHGIAFICKPTLSTKDSKCVRAVRNPSEEPLQKLFGHIIIPKWQLSVYLFFWQHVRHTTRRVVFHFGFVLLRFLTRWV